MKRCLSVISLILVFFAVTGGAFARSWNVWTAFGTSKYLQDEVPSRSVPVHLDSAGNSHEAFQVILRSSSPVQSVSVLESDLRSGKNIIPSSNVELRLAKYIEISKNLNGGYRAGFYPDALVPMTETFSLEACKAQMVWANVYVPGDAKPGIYKGRLTVKVGSETQVVPVRLQVRSFKLSVENHFGSAFAVWADQAASYYNISASSPEFQTMMERYYWFLTGYRLPPDDLPVPIESSGVAKYLDDPRVTSYRIPYVPEEQEVFKKRVSILRDKGWLSRGYVYTIDEPDSSTFGNCAAYGKQLHSAAPDVNWLLTAAPDKRLFGQVNIWSPVLHAYIDKECADRQAKKDIVWWYTCCGPQHPFPTYLINDGAVSPRILSWFQAKNKVEGVLYWAMNIWRKWDGEKYIARDVWADPLGFPGANGDGFLIYPGKKPTDDPVPTIRLEMIRKGNEDFETLYVLETKCAEVAKKLGLTTVEYDPHSRVNDFVGRLGRSLTDWTKDPAVVERVKSDVMNEIESAASGPQMVVSTSIAEGLYRKPKTVDAKIWVEKGCTISASIYADGRSTELPVEYKDSGNSKAVFATCSFPVSESSAVLNVVATKGLAKKAVMRTFKVEPAQPVRVTGGKVFSGWDSEDVVKNWEIEGANVSLLNTAELGKCAEVTYKADVDFPHIRLPFKGGKNFKNEQCLNIPISNPNDEPIVIYAKAVDLKGKIADGKIIAVRPGETTVLNWSIPELAQYIDVENIKSLELWMCRRSSPITVNISAISTSETECK